jgi:pantetheine-phosphate adenylyltransferase
MRIGLYAGSFDPVTRGHEDVIRRSLSFVDRLVVAVATNVAKQPLFSIDERKRLITLTLNGVDGEDRVDVREFDGLLVDFAREVGATMTIRGLRAVSDFEYEYQMALMNRHLLPSLETLFMVPSLDLTFISSSLVREIARFNGDLSALVHPEVATVMRARFAKA